MSTQTNVISNGLVSEFSMELELMAYFKPSVTM